MLKHSKRMRAKQVAGVFKKSLLVHGLKATARTVPALSGSMVSNTETLSGTRATVSPLWSVIVSKKVAPLAVDRNRIRRVWYETVKKFSSTLLKNENSSKFASIVVLPKGEYVESERLAELELLVSRAVENIKWYKF